MKDPQGTDLPCGEWFEVYNDALIELDLQGWSFGTLGSCDPLTTDEVTGSVLVPPGAYAVLARGTEVLCPDLGFSVDAYYPTVELGNSADDLRLCSGLTRVDLVEYDDVDFPDVEGRSLTLDESLGYPIDNNDGDNWCAASSPLQAPSQDFGTPGALNDLCP